MLVSAIKSLIACLSTLSIKTSDYLGLVISKRLALVLMTASLLYPYYVSAQETHDDTFHIIAGLGTGEFNFSSQDGLRGQLQKVPSVEGIIVEGGDSSVDKGRLIQMWCELYLGNFGIGYRVIDIYNSNARRIHVFYDDNSLPGGGWTASDVFIGQRIGIQHRMVTGQFWFAVNQSQSTRFGLIAGAGSTEYTSEYFWRQVYYPGAIEQDETVMYRTEGSATLLGVFFDVTTGVLGTRFSWQTINTKLDDFDDPDISSDKSGADGSGSVFTVDLSLRW